MISLAFSKPRGHKKRHEEQRRERSVLQSCCFCWDKKFCVVVMRFTSKNDHQFPSNNHQSYSTKDGPDCDLSKIRVADLSSRGSFGIQLLFSLTRMRVYSLNIIVLYYFWITFFPIATL